MFPVTLALAKRNLQIPNEATDQDEFLLDIIRAARAILVNYIGPAATNNPGPESADNVLTAGLIIVREFVNGDGVHLVSPRVGFSPVWQVILAHEASVASRGGSWVWAI